MEDITQLVKPMFPIVGRFYKAVVDVGIVPGNLNRETGDTVVRGRMKNPAWASENADIIKAWHMGGDVWGDLIKDIRAYSQNVSKYRRTVASKEKEAAKAAAKQAKSKNTTDSEV